MSAKVEPSPATSFSLLRRLLLEHGRRYGVAYFAALLFMGVGSAATALVAWLLKPALNHMVEPDGLRAMRVLSFAVAALFAIRGLASYFSQVLLARTGAHIVADLQSRLYDRLLDQDMAYLRAAHSGDMLARLSLAANSVRDALQVLTLSIGRDAATLFCLVVVMFVQDTALALIAVSIMPVAGYGLSTLVAAVRRLARSSFDGSARVIQTLQETLLGISVVKSFNLEDEMRARMSRAIAEVSRAANRAAVRMALASPLADLLAGVAIAIILFYGAWRVTNASADAGAFFSFVVAMLMTYEPGKRLARAHLEMQSGLAGARLIYDVLDRPPAEAPAAGPPRLEVAAGRIVFERVAFAYRPDEPALDMIDLVFEPGRTTALVGHSGAGKSTIVALLNRFYTPASGRILIDGQDISCVALQSLRQNIAYVPQDVFLFRGSIRDNIALGKIGAGDDEIMHAARNALVEDFVRAFRRGLETEVGETGANLSGGQRQRVAIARAMLKDAPILVLDEPTASLDSDSEREVKRALDRLRASRTTIVIAHRLQTILSADVIVVVDHGRVVAQGRHADLISRAGVYRDFFEVQFGQNDEQAPAPDA
ncbi:MAG: ABC transporter ATP-binding protein [Hyphomicrobiales bacterium]|nr:ABC transporter ATP-binding protein [Hyphomicrobiales bacterium]